MIDNSSGRGVHDKPGGTPHLIITDRIMRINAAIARILADLLLPYVLQQLPVTIADIPRADPTDKSDQRSSRPAVMFIPIGTARSEPAPVVKLVAASVNMIGQRTDWNDNTDRKSVTGLRP